MLVFLTSEEAKSNRANTANALAEGRENSVEYLPYW